MKRMLVVCPYPEDVAPSQRLKFEQYYDYFRQQGWEVEVAPFISTAFWKVIYKKGHVLPKAFHTVLGYLRRMKTLFTVARYDLVYVHLWVTPLGPPVFEWLYRKAAKKIVYDIDDLVYLKRPNKAHPFISIIKGRKKPIYLMRHSEHVITCTPYLDEFVRRYNTTTTDISSTIDTERYHPKTEYSSNGKFIIGWSGSHSTSRYLYLLADVFRDLSKEMDYKLVVMGDNTFSISGVEVETLPWKEEHEISTISRFDVGLYPLPDEEWVLGKSGLKALQYMALGIPTVATAIGTIFRIIDNGKNGFLASSSEEWKSQILQLRNSQALRQNIGKSAAQTVQARYSVRANRDVYLSVLNHTVAQP